MRLRGIVPIMLAKKPISDSVCYMQAFLVKVDFIFFQIQFSVMALHVAEDF